MEQNYDLSGHINRLSRLLRRGNPHAGLGRYGTWRVIRVLEDEDGVRATVLAERLGIRPSSLTEVLNRMEDSGIIFRVKDPEDSRAARIFVTGKARGEREKYEESFAARNQEISQCLIANEIREFCRISSKLADYLEKKHASGGGDGIAEAAQP